MNTINLKTFKSYLKTQHHKESTIKEDQQNVTRFIDWLKPEDFEEVVQLSTTRLVAYINFMQSKQLAASTINIRLRSIRKYYKFLESEGQPIVVKTDNLKVKGTTKKVVIDPLTFSELEELYKTYLNYLENKPIVKKKQVKTNERKSILISLLIFQGLHAGELQKLEVNHLRLNDGTLYIPSTNNGQSRELKLHPSQIITLYNFVNNLPSEQAFLFDYKVNDQIHRIFLELRGLNEKIQNARHIRASVIMHWLKLHGKRQTQYMIGHKWISSTEHYERQDLEALTNALDKFHPLLSDY
ncbi:MAG: tyrosine-type recombinase/integrase [Crocinitomix sp.]|nr:tyrosine-type recombinase/integrase [Crocinitomix sp.]